MDINDFIIRQLNILLLNGSNYDDLSKMFPKFQYDLNKPFDEIINEIVDDIKKETAKYLNEININDIKYTDGISTCIYLPYEDSGYKLTFMAGIDSNKDDISEETLFDVASITKMFTLLLTFKMIEYGYFNLDDKISSLSNRFINLKDFTIEDLLRLCGDLETKGKIQDGKDYRDSERILSTIHLLSDDRSKNKYTDYGAIVISKVIEEVYYKNTGKRLRYDEIMDRIILKPYNLGNTLFNPTTYHLAGNGNNSSLVHDPKSRALGGAVGSAGIFTTSEDLTKVAKEMFKVSDVNYDYMKNLVSKYNLLKMGTMTFPYSEQNNRGLLGLYQKNIDINCKWLVPLVYGHHTFTAQGFTGAVATFDSTNKIHNNFLVNTIKKWEKAKPDNYLSNFKHYQYYIVGKTMELYMLREYEKMFRGNVTNIDKVYKIDK